MYMYLHAIRQYVKSQNILRFPLIFFVSNARRTCMFNISVFQWLNRYRTPDMNNYRSNNFLIHIYITVSTFYNFFVSRL